LLKASIKRQKILLTARLEPGSKNSPGMISSRIMDETGMTLSFFRIVAGHSRGFEIPSHLSNHLSWARGMIIAGIG
jgi:hypothetical protein